MTDFVKGAMGSWDFGNSCILFDLFEGKQAQPKCFEPQYVRAHLAHLKRALNRSVYSLQNLKKRTISIRYGYENVGEGKRTDMGVSKNKGHLVWTQITESLIQGPQHKNPALWKLPISTRDQTAQCTSIEGLMVCIRVGCVKR